ncbi:MAG: ribonuclease P protein component [Patescibacteria group bacterium]
MLPKENRLKKDQDIKDVFKKGKSVYDSVCGIKFTKNNLQNSRFAIVTGTKVHKSAVKRNKIRRHYREILREQLEKIEKGYDVVLLTSKEALNLDKNEKQERLIRVLKKAKVIS